MIQWVIEPEVFPASYRRMIDAIQSHGHQVTIWKDTWWASKRWPRFESSQVVFHGSLNNAFQVKQELPWKPGAFCDYDAFRASKWYPLAQQWILPEAWVLVPADRLVNETTTVLESLGNPNEIFVRPDSPLKPFSGRVLPTKALSLQALDYGFYHDDPKILVVVSPVRQIQKEWRFVVVNKKVIAGSEYRADGRIALEEAVDALAIEYAQAIANELSPPEQIYVMDICKADEQLRLLELNPFSGADLYNCDLDAVVMAISKAFTPLSG